MNEERQIKRVHSVDELPDILTPPWIARIMGCSLTKAYSMIKNAKIPCTVLGNRVYLNKTQFLKWLDDQTSR